MGMPPHGGLLVWLPGTRKQTHTHTHTPTHTRATRHAPRATRHAPRAPHHEPRTTHTHTHILMLRACRAECNYVVVWLTHALPNAATFGQIMTIHLSEGRVFYERNLHGCGCTAAVASSLSFVRETLFEREEAGCRTLWLPLRFQILAALIKLLFTINNRQTHGCVFFRVLRGRFRDQPEQHTIRIQLGTGPLWFAQVSNWFNPIDQCCPFKLFWCSLLTAHNSIHMGLCPNGGYWQMNQKGQTPRHGQCSFSPFEALVFWGADPVAS